MLVLSSPSGAGKTTIAREILARDEQLVMSISTTTRTKRPNEVEGRDYYFIDEGTFSDMTAKDEFLECAEVFGHFYGTPAAHVKEALENEQDVLFDIDWQGTQQLTKIAREDVVSVFILPPSMQELEARLRKRAQDSDEVIANRMSKAAREISHWKSYDYIIINNDLEKSIEQVHHILKSERFKRDRRVGLPDFIGSLID